MTVAPVRRRPSAVVPAAPRRAARTRAERWARLRRWGVRSGQVLLVLVPLLALGWALLASSWLSLDRVEVRGTSRLTDAAVRSAVDVRPGTPLARIDTAEVAQAVRRLPPVADVTVRRSWPGTLEVTVVERTAAVGVGDQSGPGATLLDDKGVAFATARALPRGVPRLAVQDPGPDDPATRAALDVHRALPERLRTRVATLEAASPSSVVLVLRNGEKVVWGAPGDTATKAVAALALLPLPGSVVDVSAPGVAVRR